MKISIVEEDSRGRNIKTLTPNVVKKNHEALDQHEIAHLKSVGLSDFIIDRNKIGHLHHQDREWIAVPIRDVNDNYLFYRLVQSDDVMGTQKIWPVSGKNSQIFDYETLDLACESVIIVEREIDALALRSQGEDAISFIKNIGEESWDDSWNSYIRKDLEYVILFDNDELSKEKAQYLAEQLYKLSCRNIKIVNLPNFEDRRDATFSVFFERNGVSLNSVVDDYSASYPETVDTSTFEEISFDVVQTVLGKTIKKDEQNRSITFISMLTAFTEESQVNVLYNAPSSVGKSFIPMSVAELFPRRSIIMLANCSPTAFFHEQGIYDKEKNEMLIDLSRKIIIFQDMQNTMLLERLRPLLSHDSKIITSKITDKNQQGGNKTKTASIIGYPAVFFCTAGMKIDEQESTRFIILSPSSDPEKLSASIMLTIQKEANKDEFKKMIDADEDRKELKKRIEGIQQENINEVIIPDTALIEHMYVNDERTLKPRHQRDVRKLTSIIKGISLLNLWFRERDGNNIIASVDDIKQGIALWGEIEESQDYGVSPYVYDIYKNIILPLYREKASDLDGYRSVDRKEVLDRYFELHRRTLGMQQLRMNILPLLESSGLIIQERDPNNGRRMVIIPQDNESNIDIVLRGVGQTITNIISTDEPF